MEGCIFCNVIASGGDAVIWQNKYAVAIKDIHPKAPVHVLVIPKKHVINLDSLDDVGEAGQLLLAVGAVARQLGVHDGYRVAINNGRAAGQVVEHLHVHLLANKAGFATDGAEADQAAGLA